MRLQLKSNNSKIFGFMWPHSVLQIFKGEATLCDHVFLVHEIENKNVGACDDLGPTALAFLGFLLIAVGLGA